MHTCTFFIFQLPNHFQLVELSIVAGNDFTGPFMRDLFPQLDVRGGRSISNIAGWTRHYKNIQNHHVLSNEVVSLLYETGHCFTKLHKKFAN